jgi:hypothetical protein
MEEKLETSVQLIFRKNQDMQWIPFIEWLEKNKEFLMDLNKKEIELAHFHGGLKKQMAADYYRKNYINWRTWRDDIRIVNANINNVWYNRLYFRGESIGVFLTFIEAMEYAEKFYDRTTNTIKKN